MRVVFSVAFIFIIMSLVIMFCLISCFVFAAVISVMRCFLSSRMSLTSESKIRFAFSVVVSVVVVWSVLTFISCFSFVTLMELIIGR